MSTSQLDLWPRPMYDWKDLGRHASVEMVEQTLGSLFPNSNPLLFSSGRSALSCILEGSDVSRPVVVAYPPFSSHCVIDTIGRHGSPTLSDTAVARVSLVFHQWGFPRPGSGGTEPIDDSADSLIIPGPVLFPARGRWQLFSLPKLLGCAGGAFVLCQSIEDHDLLSGIRDSRKNSAPSQFALRLAATRWPRLYPLWNGGEAAQGRPSRWLGGHILRSLQRWDEVVEDRRRKWEIIRHLSLPEADPGKDRLPCCVPLRVTQEMESRLKQLELYCGMRNWLPIRGGRKTKAVLPLPIHQDVSVDRIREFALRSEH